MLEKYINDYQYLDYKLFYTCDLPYTDIHDEDVEPLKCIWNIKNKIDSNAKKTIVLGYNLNRLSTNNFVYDSYSTKNKTLSVVAVHAALDLFNEANLSDIKIYDGVNISPIKDIIVDDKVRALICIV